LNDLVEGVKRVLGATAAGVSLIDGDRMKFAAATDERVSVLERLQEETQVGPGVEARHTRQVVLVEDLTHVPQRWGEFSLRAAEVGVAAVAGIPMRLNGTEVGGLDVYDDQPRAWSAQDVRGARLLADITTGYVANAIRLDKARVTVEQLQGALDSRVVIEQAKGVLAGERKISVEEAFQILRAHARSHNASLRSVAEAVVNLRLRP
jgi:GAF domain-containing protein